MFNLLSNDLLLIITYNLTDVHDVINMGSVDKNIYKIFDDCQYIYWGRNMYSNEFWDRAKKRTKIFIPHYLNMKLELLRIHNHQNTLIKHGYEKWTNKDYYNYWESMETSITMDPIV